MKQLNPFVFLFVALSGSCFGFLLDAQVTESSADGFVIKTSHDLELGSKEAYAAFVDGFSEWYDASHSYSGKAENLSLDLEKNCMLETLPDDGFVRHMEIVFHQPGQVLRMTGGLGPLQGMGVSGAMTFTFSETGGQSKVTMEYYVSGAKHLKLDQIADPVNQVLNGQLTRFQTYCGNLKNEKEKAAYHIQQILEKDAELSDIRNHACKKCSLGDAIDEYVARLMELDFDGCPNDFTESFQEHQSAWKALVPLAEKHSKLRGEMHDLLARIEQTDDAEELAKLKKEIFDTWAKIETAAKQN